MSIMSLGFSSWGRLSMQRSMTLKAWLVFMLLVLFGASCSPRTSEPPERVGQRSDALRGAGAAAGWLAAGGYHTCALTTSGDAVCWGNNGGGQGPASVAGPFVALTAGGGHTCALKPDGSAACWGLNADGQAPASVAGPFVGLTAGFGHTCGLKPDGSAACWGRNVEGEAPSGVAGPFVGLTAGGYHTCGLKPDGSAACWGGNVNGQAPASVAGPFVGLTAGYSHTCGLKPDGSAACWGWNTNGQAPSSVTGPFVGLAAGQYHTCGRKPDGSAACWGWNNYGQAPASAAGPIIAVVAGYFHTCALKPDGSAACWGNNSDGQAPASVAGDFLDPAISTNSDTIGIRADGTLRGWRGDGTGYAPAYPAGTYRQISAGNSSYTHSCAVAASGNVVCIGRNVEGQATPLAGLYRWVGVGSFHTCGLRDTGVIVCWGANPIGQASPPSGTFRQIGVGGYNGCGIRADGTIACWGRVPNGTTAFPSLVGTFSKVAVNDYNACAVRPDGTLACWGDTRPGYQLSAPPPGAFVDVAVGLAHACAIRVDRTVTCWGSDTSHEVSYAPEGTFRTLTAGSNPYTCGVRTDGTFTCWGYNRALFRIQTPLANGTVGTAYSTTLLVDDYLQAAPMPFTFSVLAGSLPPGLALGANGSLTGTPTTAGTFTATIRAVNAENFSAVRTYTLAVADAPAAIAASSGTPQTTAVGTDFASPLVVAVTSAGGNAVAGVQVTFAVPASGSSATVSATTVFTDASGKASVTAKANTVAGSYAVTATVAGVATGASFALTNAAGAVASVTAEASSTPQSATIQTAFQHPLGVTVRDGYGNPVSGASIALSYPSSGASAVLADTATSDASGYASTTATANAIAGSYVVTASVAGVATPATFALTNLPGAPATVSAIGGTPQSTVVNTSFGQPFKVVVRDGANNPVPGMTVTFAGPATGAKANFNATATTDANGVAATSASANTIAGSYAVTASVAGGTSPATFSLTNLPGPPVSVVAVSDAQSATVGTPFGLPLTVSVVDTYGNPVSGVVVTFVPPATGASASVGTGTATTEAEGKASLAVTANAVAGTYVVNATIAGVSTPASFTLTNLPGSPGSIAVVQGSPQSTKVDTSFATELQVLVRDASNNPVAGVSVAFSAPGAGATAILSSATAVTDASGKASVTAKANTTAGSYEVKALATGVATSATFALTNTAGAAASVVADSGASPQSAMVGTAFSVPLGVNVTDAFGNAVPGVQVTFGKPASGASATLDVTLATTDAAGHASVRATANATTGSYVIGATVSGLATSTDFKLTNTAGAPATIAATGGTPQTTGVNTAFALALEVTVVDGNANPVAGATVDFVGPASGAGALLTPTSATTNAAGKASVTATANGIAGSYEVAASVVGAASPATFALTNKTFETTTVLVAVPTTRPEGTAVTFEATVSSSSGVATGVVSFKDGASLLGTAVPLVGGKATLSVSTLTAGGHVIIAEYAGDGAFAPSTSSPVTVTITPRVDAGGGGDADADAGGTGGERATDAGGDDAGGNDAGSERAGDVEDAGCSCREVPSKAPGANGGALVALGALLALRRRR